MAGALEIVWIVALEYSDGFTRLGPIMIVSIAASFALLGLSLESVSTV